MRELKKEKTESKTTDAISPFSIQLYSHLVESELDCEIQKKSLIEYSIISPIVNNHV